MNWLNIHTATLDGDDFLRSEPRSQATWLKLLRYCIGQENGGVILKATSWRDQDWQFSVRVKLKDLRQECRLWEWSGEELHVKYYPAEQESAVVAKRQAAATTHAKRRAQHDAQQVAEQDGKGRERKEREREGKSPTSNRPSVEEAIGYFTKISSDHTAREVGHVWNSFEATIQDGQWFFGRHPVGDWRAAMATRLADNRKQAAPGHATNGHPAGWQEGDAAVWWTDSLVDVRSAMSGAALGNDEKTVARLRAILALREKEAR